MLDDYRNWKQVDPIHQDFEGLVVEVACRRWAKVSAEAFVKRRRTTAIHEAGHAVIGLRNEFALNSATIESTENYHGCCERTVGPSGIPAIELFTAGCQGGAMLQSSRRTRPLPVVCARR